MNKPVRFGVNYVPSQKWWYSWSDWSAASIKEDLQAIASLGMDHIRVHCLWPIFQPNPTYVSQTALEHLHELLDFAQTCDLDVEVAVLDGWLSGFVFIPPWSAGRNMFTDPDMIVSERFLLQTIIEAIGNHPRFLGIDLGNELNVLTYFGHPMTIEQGDAWQAEMFAVCNGLAPGKFHVNGVDHGPWFADRGFGRHALANQGTATAVHAWIAFTEALSLYKYNQTGCTHLAEYCLELVHAYAHDPRRPAWLQEFGASKQWMPESAIADFAEQTIANALGCQNLWGITWWCSHDLNPLFTKFDKLEYDLGLFDSHNAAKPVGRKLAHLIKSYRQNQPESIGRSTALILPDTVFTLETKPAGWNFARQFMDLIDRNIRPAIVLESRQHDREYLKARGITELTA